MKHDKKHHENVEMFREFSLPKIEEIIAFGGAIGFGSDYSAATIAMVLFDSIVRQIEMTGSGIDIKPYLKELTSRIDSLGPVEKVTKH